MKLYNAKAAAVTGKPILLDDMIMTTDMPTTAGSRRSEEHTSELQSR